jgi:hypothetical protein
MKKINTIKYNLLDYLNEISSIQKMIDLHSTNPDKISNFMISQYQSIRRNQIVNFNKITKRTNGNKICR